MSWTTIIWSVCGGICLALAGVNLLVWIKSRESWANLIFAVAALMAAINTQLELRMMHAGTPEAYGYWHWVLHTPMGVLVIALVLFVRFYLGRVSQDHNIPLMQLISMTSYNYAKPLGDMGLKSMQVRGRMQEGMVADITIFSAENVKDNATYAKGTWPSTGVPYVLVDGVIVLKNSKTMPNTVSPGQAIRFEPITKSKFQPLSRDSWNKEFYSVPTDFGGGVPGSQPNVKGNPLQQIESHDIH